MLPRRGRRLRAPDTSDGPETSDESPPAELPYEPLVPKDRVPRSVDWRGTGADQVVKDQAHLPAPYLKPVNWYKGSIFIPPRAVQRSTASHCPSLVCQ